MFGDGPASGAHDGRYNVLLIGGDAGIGRWGLRPDSMTVASIDAATGRTVLIGLPRNMENFPFAKGSVMHEQFPHGFRCSSSLPDCMLNGVYTWALDNAKLFGGSQHPGLDATISAIEGITGLKVNYWAMVDLRGFRDLVDAVGGVTMDVRQPIPVGGLGADVTGYIKPGVQKLNGLQTQWYARSRDSSDDYSRMARQKCIMNAMLHQVQPQVVVENFEKIAKASSAMISTSIPASEVDHFMDLAIKAKGQKISTLSLVPPLIPNTAHPNFRLIRAKVAQAIASAEGKAPVATAAAGGQKGGTPSGGSGGSGSSGHVPQQGSPSTQVVTGGSLGSLSTGYVANQTSDLSTAC
jgi:LCP family protein required for cell wall assembly